MSLTGSEEETWRFQEQWAPTVMVFCRLYTGDAQVANDCAVQALDEYFRRNLPLHLDHLPTLLMSLAYEKSKDAASVPGTDAQSDFEWAVLALEADERAVFILHAILDLWLPWVAAITRISFETVNQLWSRGLIDLRLATVHDECSRLFTDSGWFQFNAEALA